MSATLRLSGTFREGLCCCMLSLLYIYVCVNNVTSRAPIRRGLGKCSNCSPLPSCRYEGSHAWYNHINQSLLLLCTHKGLLLHTYVYLIDSNRDLPTVWVWRKFANTVIPFSGKNYNVNVRTDIILCYSAHIQYLNCYYI